MRVIELLRSKEWSGRVVDCALRFVLAAVLSGARVFGGYAPFALGWTAAAGTGAYGISALAGTSLGAFLFLDFSHALRTTAAAVLIFAANSAFYDLKIFRRRAFLPLMTAAMMLAVEFVYVLRAPEEEAADCLVSLLLAALCAMSGRALLSEGREESSAASLFILLGVLMALASYETADGFAPGRIAAMLAVLLAAFERSGAAAVPTALAIGLAMDLSAGGGSFLHAAAYAFAATVVTLTRRGNRVSSALWFAFSVLCFSLPAEASVALALLYEGVSATLLFLLIPSRALRGKRLATAPSEDEESSVLRKKVSESALALREMYDSVARAPQRTEENPAAIYDRAAERVCRGCVLCNQCWEKDYNRTYTALNDATAALLRCGQGRGEDFPSYFSERCVRFASFLSAVNDELRAYLLRRQYRRRLAEDHAKAASQYAQLSELLQSAAESEARPAAALPPHPYRLGITIRPKKGEHISGDSAGHFETDDGALCLLLSDGMGCGSAAQRESAMAVRLLERFLRAGIDAPPALKTLNSALALRAESTDSFTTVDLLMLSLQTLEGELYKYGAAPSYVKRGGTVRRVTCSCLPAGLQDGSPPPEATHLRLSPGCFLVMVTDGIADTLDDEWLQDLLAGWEGDDPQLLVSAILADSLERRGGTDDASVLALYLPQDDAAAQEV